MTPALSLDVVPRALKTISCEHPNLAIEVETLHALDVSKAVSNNTADVGLAMEAPTVPGLNVTTIGFTRFVCVVPKQILFDTPELRLNELASVPMIGLNPKSPLGQVLENRLNEGLAVAPKVQIVAETYHLAKRLASEGLGVAIVDGITAFSEGASNNVSIYELPELEPIKVDLISRNNDPIVSYKADFCAAVVKSLSGLE